MPSHVQLFTIPWTVNCPAPLSMEFSRQEYWNVLLFSTPGDLSKASIKASSLGSPPLAHWQVDSLSTALPGSIYIYMCVCVCVCVCVYLYIYNVQKVREFELTLQQSACLLLK